MRAQAACFFAVVLMSALEPSAWAGRSVKRLASELEGATPAMQIMAARALGRSRKPEALAPLIKLLDVRRSSPRLSTAIVEALGELRDPRALDALMGSWDYLNSTRLEFGQEMPANLQVLRATIVEAVGAIGTERSHPLLEEAINDRDLMVVQKAATALGRARDGRSVDALISLLSRGGGLAQAAFEALGAIGNPRAVSALEGYLKSEDAESRIEAAYALSLIVGAQYRSTLGAIAADEKNEARDRVLASYYLCKLGERSGLEQLSRMAEKGKANEKTLAIQALGKSGEERAVRPLVEALVSPDPALRMLIARALGQLGGTRAVASLRRMLDDKNQTVKAAARQALIDLGEE